MASSTDNVKLGVCTILFDGIDLGYTKGGVEVEVTTSTHEVTVDQFGETAIGELITGRQVTATIPLAETTLDNLVATMPGSVLASDGVKSTGTVTFVTTAPANGDSVTILGTTFAFKTVPVGPFDLAIPGTITAAATALAALINASSLSFTATVAAGVVTVTSKLRGVANNVAITKTAGVNITLVGMAAGVDPTKAKVTVTSGVNLNLLSLAKRLVLRPRGTTGADDFIIFKAATSGALNFSYNIDKERIYTTKFRGYVLADDTMFSIGDATAV